MTRERKLAIQMWKEIKKTIIDTKRLSDIDGLAIARLKCKFCIRHQLNWLHDCWLCQYVRYKDKIHGEGCQRCPLSDGSADAILGTETGCIHNAFEKVIHARKRETKIKACDEIIRILNGRLK